MTFDAVNKEPETDVVIRFQDCDPFGHLNNARYIDYFINEREDHLMNLFEKIAVHGFNTSDFDARVKEVLGSHYNKRL